MQFAISYKIEVNDEFIEPSDLVTNVEKWHDELGDMAYLEAQISLHMGDNVTVIEPTDPIIRLTESWLQKLPWILAGDTETIPMRNSAHCFAFIPAGTAVQLSFFEGDESEIEEYIVQPTNILLTEFAKGVIGLGQSVLETIKHIDEGLLVSHSDCKELSVALSEAEKSWHDYQVRGRR